MAFGAEPETVFSRFDTNVERERKILNTMTQGAAAMGFRFKWVLMAAGGAVVLWMLVR